MIRQVHNWLMDGSKKNPSRLSKLFAEFSASVIFQFVGSIAGTASANGAILTVLVYYTAKTSGGHINPAVSLSFCMLGYINPLELFAYCCAQILGCIVGSGWVTLLVPGMSFKMEGSENKCTGCAYPVADLNMAQVFGWEAFSTFCFILPIFSVVWYTTHKFGYGNTGPIIVGLSLIGNVIAAGPYSGGVLNPARAIGSAIMFNCNDSFLLVYVLGELIGAALVTVVIAPWYGISEDPWYNNKIPARIKTFFIEKRLPKKEFIDPEKMQIILEGRGSGLINIEGRSASFTGRSHGHGYGVMSRTPSYYIHTPPTNQHISLNMRPTGIQTNMTSVSSPESDSRSSSKPPNRHLQIGVINRGPVSNASIAYNGSPVASVKLFNTPRESSDRESGCTTALRRSCES